MIVVDKILCLHESMRCEDYMIKFICDEFNDNLMEDNLIE